jgi:predicted DNA repair protein MutK
VHGLAAERELPIIWRIAKGSVRNKLLILLPAVLLLSQFLPVLLTPLLMLGGAYLCYEGAEKLWEKVSGHDKHHGTAESEFIDEDTVVSGAVRTDFILSAEIMVIALNEVVDQGFVSRAIILAVVAIGITILVYGVVGAIVKMDDVGLSLSQRPSKGVAGFGRGLVKAMPRLLTFLSVVGTAAMLWVGGHILLLGTHELGLTFMYDVVHHLEEAAHDATGAFGGLVGWLVNTLGSALLGLIVGALIVVIGSLTWHKRKAGHSEAGHGEAADGKAADGEAGHGDADDSEAGHSGSGATRAEPGKAEH